jgi:molybdopterin-guanine dinucleotide biosynthesis protein A
MTVLGAVIAGGRSRRYGEPKALAEVGGVRIVDRVLLALHDAAPEVVLIANDATLARAIGLPARPDAQPDLGALGGIHAALLWAQERSVAGVLAVACDMPFVSADLLRRLRDRADAEDTPDAVLPASDGPRGIEPLCAWYGVTCLPALEDAIERGDHRMIGFHGGVRVVTLPIDEVATFGDPALLFMNVNTPEDRVEAERLLAGSG